MIETKPQNEFRIKGGSSILNYIAKFSATEKAVFGFFCLASIITAIIMISWVNDAFMIQVPASGGQLTEGVVGLPRNVNPVIAVTDVDKDLSALVYSGLTKNSGGKMVPDIAKSFTVSSDGLVYSFILKDNAQFQDGTELTSEDIAFTIQKIQNSALKSPKRADWKDVTVTIVSPKEIKFTLKQPYTPFISITSVGILPKHIWGSVSDEQFIFSNFNIEPVGSGPYKVSSISRDSGGIPTKYTLSTWRGYYEKTPYISTLIFNFYADQGKSIDALTSGYVDSVPSIGATDALRLSQNLSEPYDIISSTLPRNFGIFFNQSQSPILADKIVRQALSMSVDRDEIVRVALDGFASPTFGLIPPTNTDRSREPITPASTATSTASSTVRAVPSEFSVNVSKAVTLLEKNGWKLNPSAVYEKTNKKDVQVLAFDLYTADTPDLKQTAEILKKQWSSIGAKVTVKVFESSELYQNIIKTRKYGALLFGEYVGQDKDLYAFWHSSQRIAPGLNIALYTNSKVDKLLENIRSAPNEESRDTIYTDLEEMIMSDFPAIFLFSPDFTYAVPKEVKGIVLRDITTPSDRFNSIGSWYVKTDNIWKIFAD